MHYFCLCGSGTIGDFCLGWGFFLLLVVVEEVAGPGVNVAGQRAPLTLARAHADGAVACDGVVVVLMSFPVTRALSASVGMALAVGVEIGLS